MTRLPFLANRRLRITLLALMVLLTLIAAAVTHFANVERQNAARLDFSRSPWAIAATEVETLRYGQALELLAHGHRSPELMDEARRRFDTTWSRVDVLKTGPEGRPLLRLPGYPETLAAFDKTLKDQEHLIDALETATPEELRAAHTAVSAIIPRLRDAFLTMLTDANYNGLRTSAAQDLLEGRLSFLLTALGSLVVLLFLLLMSEIREARRLLRQSDAMVAVLRERETELASLHAEATDAQQRAEDANRAKTVFLAHVSHELRTPLHSILGFSETINRESFGPIQPPRYAEYVQYIHQSAEHLSTLVEDLLSLSRIEAKEYTLNEARQDLGAPCRFAADLLRAKATEAAVTLVLNEPEGPRSVIYAEQRAMRQCVLNLVNNAIKFTPKGGTVTIAWGLNAAGAPEISVADTGIGISADDQRVIFDPFFQVDNGLTRQHIGAGLGLPLVKSLMELHGGTACVQSAPGQGSRFTLSLPKDRLI